MKDKFGDGAMLSAPVMSRQRIENVGYRKSRGVAVEEKDKCPRPADDGGCAVEPKSIRVSDEMPMNQVRRDRASHAQHGRRK